MTYACVIHVCLDVALREGDLHPSVIPKEHPPTSAAYSQPLVEATILTYAKTYYPQLSKKKCKTYCESILDVPPRARPALAASVASVSVCFGSLCLWWHQFWSALAASEWRLTEQTADRAYKRVTVREINQILPHHHTVFLMKM